MSNPIRTLVMVRATGLEYIMEQTPSSRRLPAVHRTAQTVEKPLTGFSDKFLQSAARIICAPAAHKFVLRRAKSRLRRLRSAQRCGARLRSLRSIFCQVHAPTENDWRIVKSSATQYHKRPHREISNLNIFWGGGS